ncbi:MAG: peptidoglycan DD-metalloendopeptidase family protein [Kurthia sp.]|nr:peptidoglycan DD-metalloendopeptidase family protein [Candidatus Kurthia equi]
MGKKRHLVVAIFTAALLIPTIGAKAESISDLQQQQSELTQKKNALSNSIQSKKEKIAEAQAAIEKSAKEVSKLNVKITEASHKIAIVKENIDQTINEIDQLQAEIEKLQKQIDDRAEVLKERARAMQQNGGKVGYLDILLGSNSFSDFIDRASAVNEIINADESIIADQKRDQKQVEEKQAEVEVKLAQQTKQKAELETLKSQLNAQKAEKKAMLRKMEKKQAKLNQDRQKLEGDYTEVVKVSKNVANKIEVEQQKAIEKARRLAEARAAQKAKAAKAAQTASGSVAAPPVTAGTWMTPTTGRLTSGYAGRNIGAGNEYHYGIDIANSAGTPIVAAADGVVFRASPLSTYGNVVMITHNIEGKTFTTVYAHMSRFATSSGKSVKKGEVIGYIGSTGRSTGPHLHFEIHVGSWVNQQTGAVNPLQYISL